MDWKNSKSSALWICLLAYIAAAVVVYFTMPFFPTHQPLWIAFGSDLLATLVIFAFSIGVRNSSLYDPYWSVIPPVIIFYWMEVTEQFTVLNWMILTVAVLWGIRLTLNWMRGWNGLTHEDWRYLQLRANNPKLYPLINLFGIHLFPTVIVFGSLLPFYFVITESTTFELLHSIGLLISFTGFFLQLISDEQLFRWRKKELKNVCFQSGLWKYSRHPNYLGEILLWWGGWCMVMGTNATYYWTIIGPVLLTLMFIFISIPLIEKRHLEKRACYKAVQESIPMLIGFRK